MTLDILMLNSCLKKIGKVCRGRKKNMFQLQNYLNQHRPDDQSNIVVNPSYFLFLNRHGFKSRYCSFQRYHSFIFTNTQGHIFNLPDVSLLESITGSGIIFKTTLLFPVGSNNTVFLGNGMNKIGNFNLVLTSVNILEFNIHIKTYDSADVYISIL